jgi:hypothetical protein
MRNVCWARRWDSRFRCVGDREEQLSIAVSKSEMRSAGEVGMWRESQRAQIIFEMWMGCAMIAAAGPAVPLAFCKPLKIAVFPPCLSAVSRPPSLRVPIAPICARGLKDRLQKRVANVGELLLRCLESRATVDAFSLAGPCQVKATFWCCPYPFLSASRGQVDC